MNGIINHYSILCLFIYLSIWLLGFPFLGDFWKSLFLEPHHLIVVVLLFILWGFIGFNIYIILYSDENKKEK